MVKICYLCKKGEIVHDKKMSGMFCTGCGECFELGAFTDEVQYREDDRGRYMAVGTTYNVEKGFVNRYFIDLIVSMPIMSDILAVSFQIMHSF